MTADDLYRHFLENQVRTTSLKDCDARAAMAALNALPALLQWTGTDPAMQATKEGVTLTFHRPGESQPTLTIAASNQGHLTAETDHGRTTAENVYAFLTQAEMMEAANSLAQASAQATPPGMGIVEVKTMNRHTEPLTEISARRAHTILNRMSEGRIGLIVENQGFVFSMEDGETGGLNVRTETGNPSKEALPNGGESGNPEREDKSPIIVEERADVKVTKLDSSTFYAVIGGKAMVITPQDGAKGRLRLTRMTEREKSNEAHLASVAGGHCLADG